MRRNGGAPRKPSGRLGRGARGCGAASLAADEIRIASLREGASGSALELLFPGPRDRYKAFVKGLALSIPTEERVRLYVLTVAKTAADDGFAAASMTAGLMFGSGPVTDGVLGALPK